MDNRKVEEHKYDLIRIAIACGIDKTTLERTNFEIPQIRELIIRYIMSIQRDNDKLKQGLKRLQRSLEEAKQGDLFGVPVSKF